MMTSAQVVETSVNVTSNSLSQDTLTWTITIYWIMLLLYKQQRIHGLDTRLPIKTYHSSILSFPK